MVCSGILCWVNRFKGALLLKTCFVAQVERMRILEVKNLVFKSCLDILFPVQFRMVMSGTGFTNDCFQSMQSGMFGLEQGKHASCMLGHWAHHENNYKTWYKISEAFRSKLLDL